MSGSVNHFPKVFHLLSFSREKLGTRDESQSSGKGRGRPDSIHRSVEKVLLFIIV